MRRSVIPLVFGVLFLWVAAAVQAREAGIWRDEATAHQQGAGLFLAADANGPVGFDASAAYPHSDINSVITVNTFDDELNSDGDCSLREAIQAANTDTAVDACGAGSGSDEVWVPEGWYALTIAGAGENGNQTGDLDIVDHLILQSAGPGLPYVDGGGLDRVLHILPGIAVHLNGLVLTNGAITSDHGGGVLNEGGSLTLNHSALWANQAGDGGGLANWASGHDATTTLNNSWVLSNTVTGGGGGILNAPAGNYSATLTLDDCRVQGNEAVTFGGGIWQKAYSNGAGIPSFLTLESSTVSGNQVDSFIDEGFGGGIAITGSKAKLVNSTVSGNEASGPPDPEAGGLGGGLFVKGQALLASLTLTNCTVISNNASTAGGGLAIVGHTGSGEIALKNTIIGENKGGSHGGGNCYLQYPSSVTSLGNNLEETDQCGLDEATDLRNTPPQAGPLADNGGPTETHALLPGSPALHAGDDAACPPTDQRGVPRPQGTACEIGSYELDVTPPVLVAFNPPDGAIDVGVDAAIVITFSEPVDTGTFEGSVIPDPGGWQGTWGASGSVLTLTHEAFDHETLYAVAILAAEDWAGYPLANPSAWSFTTEPDPCIPVQEVRIEGRTGLLVGEAEQFAGIYAPIAATEPLTLSWNSGAFGPTATYSWTLAGTYTLGITAANACGEVGGSLVVAVSEQAYRVYLPVVVRQLP